MFQLRTDEERKEASEIVLAAIEMKSSIEPQWIGNYFIYSAQVLRKNTLLSCNIGKNPWQDFWLVVVVYYYNV